MRRSLRPILFCLLSFCFFHPQNSFGQSCNFSLIASDTSVCAGDSVTLTAGGAPDTLWTTMAAGNGHRGNMFDITAINTVRITGFDGHPQSTTDIAIYYKPGTYAGSETNAGAWTLIGTATGVVAQPAGTPTPIPISVNVTIAAGQTYAFYVTSTNTAVSLSYTNGTTAGSVFSSDANIQFKEGVGMEYPFANGGSIFSPRVWNGVIHYDTPFQYLWSTGDTTPSIIVNPTITTTYSVAVTDTSAPCSSSDSVTIVTSPGPTVDIGPDTSFCNGDTVVFDAGPGGVTYQWSTGGTGQTEPIAGGGSHWVVVGDSIGCTGSDTVDVLVTSALNVNLGPDTTLCSGDSLVLDAGNPGNSYSWSTGGTNQTEIITSGGNFNVTVTDSIGCTGFDAIFVSVATVNVDLGPDQTLCDGDSVLLLAGTGNSNYLWSTGDTTNTITVAAAGTYSVTCTDPNSGCSDTDDIVLTAGITPNANFTWANVSGNDIQFTNTSSGTGTFFWQFGDGNTSNQQSPLHTYPVGGNYQVTLVVTNACGSDTSIQMVMYSNIEASLEASLDVYPNPNSGAFTVSLDDFAGHALDLEVVDLMGKRLWARRYSNTGSALQERIILEKAAKGVYFVNIRMNGARVSRKIVVE